jgi:hypothetical protein
MSTFIRYSEPSFINSQVHDVNIPQLFILSSGLLFIMLWIWTVHAITQMLQFQAQSLVIQNTVHLTEAAALSVSTDSSDQSSSCGALTHISQRESLRVTLVSRLSSCL